MNEFGVTLRSLREKRGMSQWRLAARAAIAASYVSRLESGTRLPSAETLAKLTRALELDEAEQATLYAALRAAGAHRSGVHLG